MECIDLYFNLIDEVEMDKLWQVYLTQLPRMDKDTYVSFEEYKNNILNPIRNNSKTIVSDSRTDEELESYADSIMFGNSHEIRQEKIKSRR